MHTKLTLPTIDAKAHNNQGHTMLSVAPHVMAAVACKVSIVPTSTELIKVQKLFILLLLYAARSWTISPHFCLSVTSS
jgi:hypothetical protein